MSLTNRREEEAMRVVADVAKRCLTTIVKEKPSMIKEKGGE